MECSSITIWSDHQPDSSGADNLYTIVEAQPCVFSIFDDVRQAVSSPF